MDGMFLIEKPIGMTSRDVVNILSKKFHTKKIGHTGTLDPFAAGLLLITIGNGTKISTFLEEMGKTYIAELTLGSSTSTQDIEGEVIARKEVSLPLDKKEIDSVLQSFLGTQEQIPPMYSALKVDGEPLYKKARRGEVIERKARLITIERIQLLSIHENKIVFEVDCSKGTYIRTLGVDIAKRCNQEGHLTMLTRSRVGTFFLKHAQNINDVSETDIIPLDQALSFLPHYIVEDAMVKKVKDGHRLSLPVTDPLVVVKNRSYTVLAIYHRQENGEYAVKRGLWSCE